MASGNRYAKVRTSDPTLEAIQQASIEVFDQLEEHRRGLVAAEVNQQAGNLQIGEGLFVEHTGPGGTFTLPDAALRGAGVAMLLLVGNGGTGTLTVRPQATQLVAGAASVTIAAGAANVFWSNGQAGNAGRWFRVS